MVVLDLTRSEARRRILTLFFAEPAREYHLRGLARLIGMSVGAVQNVIGKLGREGLLKRRALGNLALFSLNQQHPLHRELEALVTKTIGIAPQLSRALAGTAGVGLAFIYGSYVSVFSKAGSAWTAESDVDLLVVGAVDPRAVSAIARELGALTNRQINYTVLSVGELAERISKRDSFISEILANPILPLVGFAGADSTAPIRRKPKDLLKPLERPA
jgi:hypothetical protein